MVKTAYKGYCHQCKAIIWSNILIEEKDCRCPICGDPLGVLDTKCEVWEGEEEIKQAHTARRSYYRRFDMSDISRMVNKL